MSWLKIEDLHDRTGNELVTVSDFDATWICGGSGYTGKPQNFGISYSNDTAGATKVGTQVYTFGASADANFNFSGNPSNNGGSVSISVTPWNRK